GITITGTSTNHSEFFDPGPDAGGPGFKHLNISVSGTGPGITVSNINFLEPLKVTADFAVPSNASGTYTVTVTNPDGQTSSTTFDANCTASSCGDPTGLLASNITSSSASLSWTAVSSASNYNVDYKLSSSGTWINIASATTSTSVNLSSLQSGSTYDWRVQANCSGASGNYVSSQFITSALATCTDQYEPNNTLATAASIPVGTTINAQIDPSSDVDYYIFSTSGSQKNIRVTLAISPANYTLTLYDSKGNQLATSASSVVYNTRKAGTYIVEISPNSGFSTSECDSYTLMVEASSSTYTATVASSTFNKNLLNAGLKVYPVPASNTVTVSFDAAATTSATITFINELGQPVLIKQLQAHAGTNINTLDVSALQQGIYTVKVNNGTDIQTTKLIISK
ncbi:MAG TPA: T9SS type A sorting domain-containing protein, partial [Hanamia sp.]|nr:T9SS type A sorting domain-containing protein [Hanamia sp.]